jgi:hypothetical protein
MDGNRLAHQVGVQEQATFYKVGHPTMSNNIVQMRSKGFQVPFYAGAMASIPYYLGMEHNHSIEHRIPRDYLTPTQRIMLAHHS